MNRDTLEKCIAEAISRHEHQGSMSNISRHEHQGFMSNESYDLQDFLDITSGVGVPQEVALQVWRNRTLDRQTQEQDIVEAGAKPTLTIRTRYLSNECLRALQQTYPADDFRKSGNNIYRLTTTKGRMFSKTKEETFVSMWTGVHPIIDVCLYHPHATHATKKILAEAQQTLNKQGIIVNVETHYVTNS